MQKDELGKRMKEYENITRNYLTKRVPVIIRIDGKAFHTFTLGMDKPFDEILSKTMMETCKYLCENIQGCKIGYVQSDEISLLLTDYETIKTDAWFDYNIQKLCSISASMATLAFNKIFRKNVEDYNLNLGYETYNSKLELLYRNKIDTAMFDSRAFVLPKEEVCNYFIWRQQDASRNSIQMVAQSQFSHKSLQNKNCNQLQEMLFQEKGINWNDLPIWQKRGTCTIKEEYTLAYNGETYERTRWIIDKSIPVFTQDRKYIEKYL